MFVVWKVSKPLGLEIRPKNEKSWANSKICRVNFVQKVIDQSKFWQSQPIEDFFGVLATHVHARNMASKPTWALGHKRRDCANTILGPTVKTYFWAWRKKPSWTNQNGLMGACHRPYLFKIACFTTLFHWFEPKIVLSTLKRPLKKVPFFSHHPLVEIRWRCSKDRVYFILCNVWAAFHF